MKSYKPLVTKPSRLGREKHVDFVRERIYGGVTVFAVTVGLLVKGSSSVKDASITVLSTIGGLWLASLFAGVLSYRVVHDKMMPRMDFIHELAGHRGLLLSAVPPLFMFGLAGLDLIDIRTAIIAYLCIGAIALTVTIARSGKTSSNSFVTAAVSFAVQAAVAGLIILVKLGAE